MHTDLVRQVLKVKWQVTLLVPRAWLLLFSCVCQRWVKLPRLGPCKQACK